MHYNYYENRWNELAGFIEQNYLNPNSIVEFFLNQQKKMLDYQVMEYCQFIVDTNNFAANGIHKDKYKDKVLMIKNIAEMQIMDLSANNNIYSDSDLLSKYSDSSAIQVYFTWDNETKLYNPIINGGYCGWAISELRKLVNKYYSGKKDLKNSYYIKIICKKLNVKPRTIYEGLDECKKYNGKLPSDLNNGKLPPYLNNEQIQRIALALFLIIRPVLRGE